MRILHIGDIVGKPGRDITVKAIPILRKKYDLDFVIANAENSAGGSGITPQIYNELIQGGVNCITLGDHIYRRREIFSVLEGKNQIVKPANFPSDSPGKGWTVLETESGVPIATFSLLGRVFMKPVDCPFAAAEKVLSELPDGVQAICLDFHAEATSDMQIMGRLLDGKVASVLGTHTHVTTADEQILPGGTAFQCDIGMTGPHESILGRKIDRVMETTLSFRPTYFEVASEDVRLSATLVEVDLSTRKATLIQRISIKAGDLANSKI